jgi:hypothetical protein
MKNKEQVTPGFKGFDANWKCRDMQYEVGKTFEIEKGKELTICPGDPSKQGGLHFCENPLDVLCYYGPASSKFAEVEGFGEAKMDGSNTKVAVSELFVKAEITLHSLLNLGVEFILSKVNFKDSAATNTGNYSAATNTGNYSAATNTGYRSAATNTGYRSAATNTGYSSAATNTGNYSAATNTGDSSAATVEGKESVAVSLGINGKAKGVLGCFIVIAEWEFTDVWHRKNVVSLLVDGESVKENTFYSIKDGIVVEVE